MIHVCFNGSPVVNIEANDALDDTITDSLISYADFKPRKVKYIS